MGAPSWLASAGRWQTGRIDFAAIQARPATAQAEVQAAWHPRAP